MIFQFISGPRRHCEDFITHAGSALRSRKAVSAAPLLGCGEHPPPTPHRTVRDRLVVPDNPFPVAQMGQYSCGGGETAAKALFDAVQAARLEYRKINATYDAELQAAHDSHEQTLVVSEHLANANRIAPQVSKALRRYHDAAADPVAFYRARHG